MREKEDKDNLRRVDVLKQQEDYLQKRRKLAQKRQIRTRKILTGTIIGALTLLVVCMGSLVYSNIIHPQIQDVTNPFSISNAVFGLEKENTTGTLVDSYGSQLAVCENSVNENLLDLTSETALLIDLTNNDILYAKNASVQRYPASITKIMTALVALKYGNLDDVVTVSNAAYNIEADSSVCDIKPGDQLTLRQLIYGMMIASGNDAAMMIAEHIGGSTEGFVKMMNDEAQEIGATSTHFMNPHGLTDPEHYTTAYDIYLIFNQAMQYDTFLDIISKPNYYAEYTAADGNMAKVTWESTNHYFTGDAQAPDNILIYGGKTGTTSEAGACLSLMVKDAYGNPYMAIILKAATKDSLYTEMSELLALINK